MPKPVVLATLVALTLPTAGCGIPETWRAEATEPGGSAFDRLLYADYRALAAADKREGDWQDAGEYAAKAIAAARGASPAPFDPEKRNIPPFALAEMKNGHERLLLALDRGGRVQQPQDAARAQAQYDCWIKEREQHLRPERIDACRIAFWRSLARLEAGAAARDAQARGRPAGIAPRT